MNNKEFFADFGFYKEKIAGSVETFQSRLVGISYQNGYYNVTDIKTGLSLYNGQNKWGNEDSVIQAENMVKLLESLPKEKIEAQIKKFESLPILEKDKIIIRKNERLISGMLNLRYFECSITDSTEGMTIELKDANLFSEKECDMIIDQIQEVLKNESIKG